MNPRTYGPSRILVLDDEIAIALTLGEILDMQGYEAAVCVRGEDALERAPRFLPDLLLTDIDLGQTNGVDVALRIRSMLPQCRVLFISGHLSLDDCTEHLLLQPYFSYLEKPFQIPELLSTTARILSDVRCVTPGYANYSRPDRNECSFRFTAMRFRPWRPAFRRTAASPTTEGGGEKASLLHRFRSHSRAPDRKTRVPTGLTDVGDRMDCSFDADSRLVEALQEHCCPVISRSGCTLFHQSDTPTGIYLLLRGRVSLEMRSEAGGVLAAIDVVPVSILGLHGSVGNDVHKLTATARPGSQLKFLPRERLHFLLRAHPSLHPDLLNVMAREVWSIRRAMAEYAESAGVPASKPVRAERQVAATLSSRLFKQLGRSAGIAP